MTAGRQILTGRNYPETGFWEMNFANASQFDFFRPTTQPTKTYVLYDFRVVLQSPAILYIVVNLTTLP